MLKPKALGPVPPAFGKSRPWEVSVMLASLQRISIRKKGVDGFPSRDFGNHTDRKMDPCQRQREMQVGGECVLRFRASHSYYPIHILPFRV